MDYLLTPIAPQRLAQAIQKRGDAAAVIACCIGVRARCSCVAQADAARGRADTLPRNRARQRAHVLRSLDPHQMHTAAQAEGMNRCIITLLITCKLAASGHVSPLPPLSLL